MSTQLLSFKAGLVEWNEDTKDAVPKRGQGTVTVAKSPDDEALYTFKWAPRGEFKKECPEDKIIDLLLFPGDALWEHVPECNTGRVYALTYKSSGQRLLFWMQSPNEQGDANELTDEDKQIAQKICNILEDESVMGGDVDDDEELPDADSVQTPARHQNQPQLTDLLRSIQVPSSSDASGTAQQHQEVPVMSITDSIPVSQMVQQIERLSEDELRPLLEHIPEGLPKTREELVRVVRSSQFAQSVDSFGSVLNNEGVGGLVSQQLGYEYHGEGIEGFLRGSQAQAKKDKENKMDQDE